PESQASRHFGPLLSTAYSPPRRGGVAAPIENVAKPPKGRRRGGQTGIALILPNRPPRRFAPPLLCEEGNISSKLPRRAVEARAVDARPSAEGSIWRARSSDPR